MCIIFSPLDKIPNMSGTRRSERIAKQKCLKADDTTICNLARNSGNNPYQRRKTQKQGKDSAFIKKDGIDYNGSDPLISELFDTNLLPTEIKTRSGVEKLKRSYIYIISKKIDGRTFIKIGVSNTTSLRLGSLQTALIPGLENIGFKLHYLLFYKHESSEGTSTFAENIEQHLHKLLRNHEGYKNMVIHFPSNNPSEWYLPDSQKNAYIDFFQFVLDFISVQTPAPEQGYHFFVANKKNTREFKTKFLKESTRQEVLQYRRDHVKVKEGIMIQRKLTQKQNLFKKGSKAYFIEKLVKPTGRVLSDNYDIVEIYYHKGKTNSIRLHGNYYARIRIRKQDTDTTKTKGTKNAKNAKNAKTFDDIKSYIQLSYSEKVGDETYYWSHVFNVLEKMREIGTLEPAGLLTNYNHYFTQPVLEAKRIVSAFSNKDVTLKRSQVNWIVGRHVRDKDDGLYIATSVSETNAGKIKDIVFAPVDPNTMLRKAEAKEITANVVVAVTLAIEYHENKVASYVIDEEYELEEDQTKYKMYDFILFNKNYFKDFETEQPIQDEFIGIILQNYDKFDKQTEKYTNYYDVLFEDELWRLETDSVDKNSEPLVDVKKKKKFVSKLKNERNLISKVIKELGLNTEITRMTTRSTTAKAKPKSNVKQKAKAKAPRQGTRKSARKQNTSMKLRSQNP